MSEDRNSTDLEECIDRLDECIETLDAYPRLIVASALGAHLTALMRALLETGQCTSDEVKALVKGLETDLS
ncbi:MAG TPA: hypothetical protein VJQ47_04395 [Steroidobacteraceae bacterium]|nr:hypothetical protein [Steroidobacteraceae bacterium]